MSQQLAFSAVEVEGDQADPGRGTGIGLVAVFAVAWHEGSGSGSDAAADVGGVGGPLAGGGALRDREHDRVGGYIL